MLLGFHGSGEMLCRTGSRAFHDREGTAIGKQELDALEAGFQVADPAAPAVLDVGAPHAAAFLADRRASHASTRAATNNRWRFVSPPTVAPGPAPATHIVRWKVRR